MKYIVLLRGINISGKNKISMNELKEELLKNNYTDVLTYLNSGNIILKSNKSEKDISDDVNKIIMNKFNIDIPVYVIKLEELIDVLNNNPSWWGINNKDIYDNIIFIVSPTKVEEVIDVVGEPSENIDRIKVYKNVIFWSFDLKNYSKSNWWIKTASTSITNKITIRTGNTIKKLIKKVNE